MKAAARARTGSLSIDSTTRSLIVVRWGVRRDKPYIRKGLTVLGQFLTSHPQKELTRPDRKRILSLMEDTWTYYTPDKDDAERTAASVREGR